MTVESFISDFEASIVVAQKKALSCQKPIFSHRPLHTRTFRFANQLGSDDMVGAKILNMEMAAVFDWGMALERVGSGCRALELVLPPNVEFFTVMAIETLLLVTPRPARES